MPAAQVIGHRGDVIHAERHLLDPGPCRSRNLPMGSLAGGASSMDAGAGIADGQHRFPYPAPR